MRDRPLGLGAGLASLCMWRCVVVDDARYGGIRSGLGEGARLGPIGVLDVRGPLAR